MNRGCDEFIFERGEKLYESKLARAKNIDIYDKIIHILGGTNMFWIGMKVN